MRSQLDLKICEQLNHYLAEEMSLEDFESWLLSATWDIERIQNGNVYELASEIELRLAEFSNGHWSENDLRRELRLLSQGQRNPPVPILTQSPRVAVTFFPFGAFGIESSFVFHPQEDPSRADEPLYSFPTQTAKIQLGSLAGGRFRVL